MAMLAYNSGGTPGVDVLPKEGQNTAEAAAQALINQAPGSEFTPLPHPDVKAILARLSAVEAESTAICNKLYMGTPPTYMVREQLYDQQSALDAERNALRNKLDEIYEGVEGHESTDGPAKPFTGDATVMGADAAPGVTTTNAKASTTNS